MVALTAPSFTGLPGDPIKVVDPYAFEVDPKVQNALTSKVSAFDTSIDSLMDSTLKAVKGLGSALSGGTSNINSAKDRLQQALKGSRWAIEGIAGDFEKNVSEELTGVPGGTSYVRQATDLYRSVSVITDGAKRNFGSGSYKSVSGILDFIGDLTGTPVLKSFDLGAQAALMKGVVGEVTQWGVPELLDTSFGAAWNEKSQKYDYQYDDKFRFSVISRSSADLSPTTDLSTVIKLIQIGGDNALTAQNPSFPEQLISSYAFPVGTIPGGPLPAMIPDPVNPGGMIADPTGAQSKPNYVDELRKLVSILNTLKPTWFQRTRQVAVPGSNPPSFRTDTVTTFEIIALASEDAKKLLMSDGTYRDAVMAAPFYKKESGASLLRAMYPYIVLEDK